MAVDFVVDAEDMLRAVPVTAASHDPRPAELAGEEAAEDDGVNAVGAARATSLLRFFRIFCGRPGRRRLGAAAVRLPDALRVFLRVALRDEDARRDARADVEGR